MISSALNFGTATADRVLAGNLGSANPTEFTWMGWQNPSSVANTKHLFAKEINTTPFKQIQLQYRATGDLRLVIPRATTDAIYTTTGLGLLVNRNSFIAVTGNQSGGAGTLMHIFAGDERNPAVEASYTGNADGSGAFTNLATALYVIGNVADTATTVLGFHGYMWTSIFLSKAFSLLDIRRWQFNPNVLRSALVCYEMAANGNGTVIDKTGNGFHGIPTAGCIPVNRVLPRIPTIGAF